MNKKQFALEGSGTRLLLGLENKLMDRLMGPRRACIARTVIQLYFAERLEWMFQYTGVVCVVKNVDNGAYLFELYCMERKQRLWEQEIYANFNYFVPTDFFHMFEGTKSVIGFNFANITEAKHFKSVVLKLQPLRKTTALSKRCRIIRSNVLPKRRRSSRAKFISEPRNFIHVAHVGLQSTFTIPDLEDQCVLRIIEEAGLPLEVLDDANSRKVIEDFMENCYEEIQEVPIGTSKRKNKTKTELKGLKIPAPPPLPMFKFSYDLLSTKTKSTVATEEITTHDLRSVKILDPNNDEVCITSRGNSIINALSRVLQDRRRCMSEKESTDSSESSSDSDNSEWND